MSGSAPVPYIGVAGGASAGTRPAGIDIGGAFWPQTHEQTCRLCGEPPHGRCDSQAAVAGSGVERHRRARCVGAARIATGQVRRYRWQVRGRLSRHSRAEDRLMKRLGILTAGGDTPALNATIYGAVMRANQLRIEVVGLIKGFNSLFNPRVPHVHLNPLFQEIPELDPTLGGTLLAASRDYFDPDDKETLHLVCDRLQRLGIEGLICVGGDGTMNGMQALAEYVPVVLAPKTIDNDLGLNYRGEAAEFERQADNTGKVRYKRNVPPRTELKLEEMVNYVTPGYATAVFVSASGIERVRTTAESHRRIAIVEVMGRHSGFIALGSAYGQPDMVLIPESPIDLDRIVERVRQLYELQKHVVIVCGEGIVDQKGRELGAERESTDPSGNTVLGGAAEALRRLLASRMGDQYFRDFRRGSTAGEVIFTRKIGHIQRGGRPVRFDRVHAAGLGAKSVELLLAGRSNEVATLQWSHDKGFYLDSFPSDDFRDRWGHIHARQVHPCLYDAKQMKPSATGIEYLLKIFSHAIGHDDVDSMRSTFDAGHLLQPYHSVSVDVGRRIQYLS
jgi:6-phosphofructokinase